MKLAQITLCFCIFLSMITHAGEEERLQDDQAFRVLKSPDEETYFPKGKESYYTEYYRAAKLPSLLNRRANKGEFIFRIGFIPSFTKPIFLTYSSSPTGGEIEIKRLSLRRDDMNQLQPGDAELQGKVAVGEFLAKKLERDVLLPDIRTPLRKLTDDHRDLIAPLDGSTWILEVCTDNDYTFEAVHSPEWISYITSDKGIEEHGLQKHDLPFADTKWFCEFCDDLLEIVDMKLPEYDIGTLLDDGGSSSGSQTDKADNNPAEQGGTEQPATRPESNSEDVQKPQPESEGRSR